MPGFIQMTVGAVLLSLVGWIESGRGIKRLNEANGEGMKRKHCWNTCVE